MKTTFSLLCVLIFVVSCSSIEDATSKWKTPEANGAGIDEGDKSHYLDSSIENTPPSSSKKAAKKKAIKK